MDIQYQTEMRDELLEAWAKGRGDPEEIDELAGGLSHHIRESELAANFHLPTILTVGNGPLPVPEANMILHDCYLRGWGTKADQAEALRRLEKAITQGSEAAEWYLASYLLNNERLAEVLPRNEERALAILRRLARTANDLTAMSLARRSLSSHLSTNSKLADVSPMDLEIVTWHADDIREVIGMDHLYLARFFAGEQSNGDYGGALNRRSRELLMAGSKSRSQQVRDACDEQLAAWSVRAVQETEPTTVQKAVENAKVVGMFGGVGVILLFWSVVGLFLLSIAAAISAVAIAVVLSLLVVGFIVSWLRR